MATLEIIDLHANVEDKEILKGVNLKVSNGETLALIGPNGHGKSTLLSVIMGHPKYVVTKGKILLDGKDVLKMKVNERSCAGLFLGMQYPSEVPGVVNADFLKAAINAHQEKPITLFKFYRSLESNSKEMKIPMDMANRSLNEGFSGGEKKRNEILQMRLLNPSIAMLDEIDSGLDVDALQTVAEAIKKQQVDGTGFLVISHYARLYELIAPTRVAIMVNGRIVVEGDKELIKKIDNDGYEWIRTELGINIEKEQKEMKDVSIGTCATKEAIKSGK